MQRLLSAATVFLLVTSPAVASEPESSTQTKTPERVVCKTSKQIGSLLKKRKSCRTVKEWAELNAETQEETRDYQRVGLNCTIARPNAC